MRAHRHNSIAVLALAVALVLAGCIPSAPTIPASAPPPTATDSLPPATSTLIPFTGTSQTPTTTSLPASDTAIPPSATLLPPTNAILSETPEPASATPADTASPTSAGPQWGRQTKTSGCVARGPLQDPDCTPGDIFPTATAAQVCTPGYSSSVRDVPTSEKDAVYAEYGITSHGTGQYEVDHLISLELGGSNDISNLWPEAANPAPGFHQKDVVENYLHAQVCNGAMTLAQAQQIIATDWLAVYTGIPAAPTFTPAAVVQPTSTEAQQIAPADTPTQEVAPTQAPTQAGARVRTGATCNDGTSSTATGSGACSKHGGVRCWNYSDGTCTKP
jgi:hypothetical protein